MTRHFTSDVFKVLFIATSLTAVVGCIHVNEHLILKPDGSAVVHLHYSVPIRWLDELERSQRQIDRWQGRQSRPGDPVHWFFSRNAAETTIEQNGFHLEAFRTYERDGRRHADLRYTSTDVKRLFQTGLAGDFLMNRQADGKVRLDAVLLSDPGTNGEEVLGRLVAGMRLRLTVTTPGPIVSSTAHQVENQSATWVFDTKSSRGFLREQPRISVTYRSREETDAARDPEELTSP